MVLDLIGKGKLNAYGLNVYDLSVDYDAVAVNGILGIHKYLIKNNNMILKCLVLLKNCFL